MIVPVVYFSSSNNTAYIARIIAKGMEGPGIEPQLVRVEDIGAGKVDVSRAGVIGVGAPIYGSFAEPIMRWAKSFDFSGKRVFLFSTAQKHFFGATARMAGLVRKRDGLVVGAFEMKFPGAGDGVFFSKEQADKHPIQRSDLDRALRFGREISTIVKSGNGYADYTYRHRAGASLMPVINALKKTVLGIVKRGLFESSCGLCTGGSCTACAGVCPVDAIEVKDRCPEIDKSKCIACFRCFKECPAGVFSLRFSEGKEYYRGPWQLKGYIDPDELALKSKEVKGD